MGWSGDLRALLCALAVLASPAVAVGSTDGPAATPDALQKAKSALPAESAPQQAQLALSEEDLEVLENLELLMQLEMLRDWDPDEDLPIPLGGDGR